MYEVYEKQIGKIIVASEKKMMDKKNNKQEPIAPITMYKLIIGAISKYVKKESENNTSFREALGLEWKSAERLLIYIWKKAKELAVPGEYLGGQGMGCVIPSTIVYAWINEYYFLDDKEEVEKEEAEKARKQKEAEEKARIDAELEIKAREKAIEKLSSEEGWDNLSDEEKEKKIVSETRSIKNRMGKKKTTTGNKRKRKTDKTPSSNATVDETILADSTVIDCADNEPQETPNQFTLFDLM